MELRRLPKAVRLERPVRCGGRGQLRVHATTGARARIRRHEAPNARLPRPVEVGAEIARMRHGGGSEAHRANRSWRVVIRLRRSVKVEKRRAPAHARRCESARRVLIGCAAVALAQAPRSVRERKRNAQVQLHWNLTFEFSRARRPQAGVRRLERRVGRHFWIPRWTGLNHAMLGLGRGLPDGASLE